MIDQSSLSIVEKNNFRMDKADIILFCMRDMKLIKSFYFMDSDLCSKEVPKIFSSELVSKQRLTLLFGYKRIKLICFDYHRFVVVVCGGVVMVFICLLLFPPLT